MTLKEKKRKLSEILGINLFEPRYREIDAALSEDEEREADKESPQALPEAPPEDAAAADETEAAEETDEAEKNTEAADKQDSDEPSERADEPETAEEEVEPAEPDEAETAEGENDEAEQTAAEESESTEPGEAQTSEAARLEAELFDARLEAGLLRLGIREDKLDAAKKLFKADHASEELNKLEGWVKEYPEWTRRKSAEAAKGFGMGVGERDSAETAEDKRLRELGIL